MYRAKIVGTEVCWLRLVEEKHRAFLKKTKAGRLNISFIGAIFQWTRWRNLKRALYFASRDDSLLSFADISELAGLRQQDWPTLRGVRPHCVGTQEI